MITHQQVVAFVGRHILERSAPYLDGALFNRQFDGETLSAECQGSALAPYRVEVRIDDDRILGSECDCPYVYSDVCKHVGAVLLDYMRNPGDYTHAQESAGQRTRERGFPADTAALVHSWWSEAALRIGAGRYDDALAYLDAVIRELYWLSLTGEHPQAYIFVALLLRAYPTILERANDSRLRMEVFLYLVEVMAAARHFNEPQSARDAQAIIQEHIQPAELLPFVAQLRQLHSSRQLRQGAWLDSFLEELAGPHFGADEWETYYLICNDSIRLLKHHLAHGQEELALIAARRVPADTLINIATRQRRHKRAALELALLEAGHRGQPDDLTLLGLLGTRAWQRQDWEQSVAYGLKRFRIRTRGVWYGTLQEMASRLGMWHEVRRQLVIAYISDDNIDDLILMLLYENEVGELLELLPTRLASVRRRIARDSGTLHLRKDGALVIR